MSSASVACRQELLCMVAPFGKKWKDLFTAKQLQTITEGGCLIKRYHWVAWTVHFVRWSS